MDGLVRTQVRIPREISEWLKELAKDQSRSMNAQLVELLKQKKREQAAA